LEIIVKMASMELSPEHPELLEEWHIVGQMNECICATALYDLDSENVASDIEFRMQTDTYLHDDVRSSRVNIGGWKVCTGRKPARATKRHVFKVAAALRYMMAGCLLFPMSCEFGLWGSHAYCSRSMFWITDDLELANTMSPVNLSTLLNHGTALLSHFTSSILRYVSLALVTFRRSKCLGIQRPC
jgi:hypothetical protein